MKGKPWSAAENSAAVSVYNYMMSHEGRGELYSKAAYIRALRNDRKPTDSSPIEQRHVGALADRGRGSIEFKFGNISAARADLGLPLLKGYKAAGNCQKSLREMIKTQTRVHTIPPTEDKR
jgi:hypothetical protein